MKTLFFTVAIILLFPFMAAAWTARVEFTPPGDPSHVTGVFISETAGDYSECFGQLSKPGRLRCPSGT